MAFCLQAVSTSFESGPTRRKICLPIAYSFQICCYRLAVAAPFTPTSRSFFCIKFLSTLMKILRISYQEELHLHSKTRECVHILKLQTQVLELK